MGHGNDQSHHPEATVTASCTGRHTVGGVPHIAGGSQGQQSSGLNGPWRRSVQDGDKGAILDLGRDGCGQGYWYGYGCECGYNYGY